METKVNEPTKKQSINKSKDHKFDKGSIFSVLLKTSLPIMLLMFFNSLYSFVDVSMSTNFVDYGGSTTTLNGSTAISVVFPLMTLLNAFTVFYVVGAGLAYTQFVAKEDYVSANKALGQSMTLTLIMGAFILLFILILGIPYLFLASGNIGAFHPWGEHTHDMILDSWAYMLLIALAFIPMSLSQAFIRVLRAEGSGVASSLIPILSLPINLAFDYIFMGLLNTGVWGAGLATFIAASLSTIFLYLYILFSQSKKTTYISFEKVNFKLTKTIVTLLIVFGTGSIIRRLFDSTSIIVLTTILSNSDASQSEVPIPVWQTSLAMFTLSINLGIRLSLGVAQAMAMLVSYYNSNNEKEKIFKTLIYGFLFMVGLIILTCLILVGLENILFTLIVDPDITNVRGTPLDVAFWLTFVWSIFFSFQMIPIMFYSGSKKPKQAIIHSTVFNLIQIVLLLIVFPIEKHFQDPLIIFYALPLISFIPFVVISIIFYKQYNLLSK